MQNNNNSNARIGFCGVLALIFITLKLMGFLTWSWLWVLSPIWIPFVVFLLIAVALFIIYLIEEVRK